MRLRTRLDAMPRECRDSRRRLTVFCIAAVLGLAAGMGKAMPGEPAPPRGAEILARLKAAYPSFVTGLDGNTLVFAGGSSLPLDDGAGEKPIEAWLAKPDIEDMFRLAYPAGAPATAPAKDFDPGRARNDAFFSKIYGDCRAGGVAKNLIDVTWLPKKSGETLRVTKINGVAPQLQAVSDELDALPARFNPFLYPSAGTFNCRPIAGTKSLSAHGYGIAIDIAVKNAHYWRWAKGGPEGVVTYENTMPLEIVSVFEKHGFIWGGRWSHYDTMHFEYRPELLPPPETGPTSDQEAPR